MPKVSVIIPVYGVEKYIERCAVSLFEQTLDDIEYIFVDDCTPDRSMEILESIIEKYRLLLTAEKKNVRIERMPTNSGQAAVRRHGVQLATGDYIIHCDSDDWVDVDMYRAMYEKAVESDYDMVCSDYIMEYSQRSINCKGYVSCGDNISNFLLRRNKCAVWNKLVKRKYWSSEEITYPAGNMGEDLAVILQIIPKCGQIGYIDKPYYHYRINDNSITQVVDSDKVYKNFCHLKENINVVIDYYIKHNLFLKYKWEFVSLKFHAKQCIEPLIEDAAMYNIWRETYPEVNMAVFFCPYIRIKTKLVYIKKFIFHWI